MRIGFAEIIVIVVVALALVKPDKLEDYAAALGRAIKSFTKVQAAIDDEVTQPIVEAITPIVEAQSEVAGAMHDVEKALKGGKT